VRVRKYAAIDIGSNAIRLLVHNVVESPDKPVQFYKSALVRVPVRLGEDSFTSGVISPQSTRRIAKTLKAFGLLMEVSGVEKYRACATSALREARNGPEVIAEIFRETGMEVEVIDGHTEAAIIAHTDLRKLIRQDRSYLYVDVGGGSTEFTLFSGGQIVSSRSFKIGTVRLLKSMVTDADWAELKEWISGQTGSYPGISIIGSGGNINKLHKMSGRKREQPLSFIWLNAQYHFLKAMSYEDRVAELGLNPDRADVILPAAQIFLQAAKWSGSKMIHVPQIGLADGLIRDLYYREEGIVTGG
jgi:exopolyphosphatase/guanosine-5'-triphosphate,3'-diphosphate pyrophosphatase